MIVQLRSLIGVAAGAAAMVAGCTPLAPDEEGAAAAARAFHAAIRESDGARACSLLAPGTRTALEGSSGAPCAQAIGEQKLPPAGDVLAPLAYGRGAQVVLDHDVVFLAVFGRDWKVTAAGCTRRPAQPYDCLVKGG